MRLYFYPRPRVTKICRIGGMVKVWVRQFGHAVFGLGKATDLIFGGRRKEAFEPNRFFGV